jgi:hypothetical protein
LTITKTCSDEFLSLNAIEHLKFAPKSRFGESLPFENLLMKLTFIKLSELRNCHSPALLRISPFAIRQSLMKLTQGVNFTNILRAVFSYVNFAQSFFVHIF